jgi:hypothetical protein
MARHHKEVAGADRGFRMRRPLLFRFDGLRRHTGPRLHRAQEEIGHMIAEADNGRVVVPVRLRGVAARAIPS